MCSVTVGLWLSLNLGIDLVSSTVSLTLSVGSILMIYLGLELCLWIFKASTRAMARYNLVIRLQIALECC